VGISLILYAKQPMENRRDRLPLKSAIELKNNSNDCIKALNHSVYKPVDLAEKMPHDRRVLQVGSNPNPSRVLYQASSRMAYPQTRFPFPYQLLKHLTLFQAHNNNQN
jgi:hypothetical protein